MNPGPGTPFSADLLEQMNRARFETIRNLAQIAGEVMEMARSAEKSLYNINSTEAKILRSGMGGAALAAAEQLGQAVFQAVMKRVEAVLAEFVPRAEFDKLVERLQVLEQANQARNAEDRG
jgi:hypothetical protein